MAIGPGDEALRSMRGGFIDEDVYRMRRNRKATALDEGIALDESRGRGRLRRNHGSFEPAEPTRREEQR